jgi:two-component system phosphate regulon sensor histidine kinase PhoR
MMLPVRHEQRVVGVVQVMSDEGPYTREQLELVEGLVGLMGAAVRNARLYDQAQGEAAARARAEAVAAERENASRVLEAVGDGIMLVDDAGSIRFWNPAAELITGLARKRALGTRADRVFRPWDHVAEQVPAAEGDAPAQQVTLPVEVNRRELWLAFVAVRSPEGCVYAFRDLSAERSLEQAKSEFIATVSHELRTPMTGVLGAAMTLLRRDVDFSPELRQELLEMIANQARRLTRVTDDVLLASNLDSASLDLESGDVDVSEVVVETVESMRPRLPDGIAMRTRARAGSRAAGDRDRIQQVLVNLLDNAVKYSPHGGTIVASTSRLRDVVRIAVKDEGLGIPAAEHERVFEKFYRREPHLHGPGGTGLGLYICRALVERMGGRIGVRSEPGKGATFFVDLPPA